MIEVFRFETPGDPFSKKSIGMFKNPREIMRSSLQFTAEEIASGLGGDVIRDQYAIELAPKFLDDIAIDDMIERHHGRMTEVEIGHALNMSDRRVRYLLTSTLKKLRALGPNIREFTTAHTELRKIRDRRWPSGTTCEETVTVTVSV